MNKKKMKLMMSSSDELIQEIGDDAEKAYTIDDTEVETLLQDDDRPDFSDDEFDLDEDVCSTCRTPRENDVCPYGCED
jgi:hypothetical protein